MRAPVQELAQFEVWGKSVAASGIVILRQTNVTVAATSNPVPGLSLIVFYEWY